MNGPLGTLFFDFFFFFLVFSSFSSCPPSVRLNWACSVCSLSFVFDSDGATGSVLLYSPLLLLPPCGWPADQLISACLFSGTVQSAIHPSTSHTTSPVTAFGAVGSLPLKDFAEMMPENFPAVKTNFPDERTGKTFWEPLWDSWRKEKMLLPHLKLTCWDLTSLDGTKKCEDLENLDPKFLKIMDKCHFQSKFQQNKIYISCYCLPFST